MRGPSGPPQTCRIARQSSKRSLRVLEQLSEPDGADLARARLARPRTRGDCVDGPRPCPWVSCRHHLFLDVEEDGGIIVARPEVALRHRETCSLDLADDGPMTLDAVGAVLGVTRERIRQIEAKALRRKDVRRQLRDAFEAAKEDPAPSRKTFHSRYRSW